MEAQVTSILSQSLAHPMPMDSHEPKKTTQYDAVKMRYFLSLGMNRPTPQLSSSVPTSSSMLMSSVSSVTPVKNIKRDRTKTNPPTQLNIVKAKDLEDKRTTSIPIPIAHGFTVPIAISSSLGTFDQQNNVDSDEEYDLKEDQDKMRLEEEEDIFEHDGDQILYEDHSPSNNNDSPVKFIPPHEMMRLNSKHDFNVGTAHSVAVWEQRRRKFI